MTVDITRTAIRVRVQNLLITLLFSALIIIVLLSNFFNSPILGLSRGMIILLLAVIYFLYAAYGLLLDRYYVFLNDDGQKIVFRYYSMRPLSQLKHSIEIPKGNFKGYEINYNRLGFIPRIVLFQQQKSGIFKYPPVSLSALSKKELDQVERLLDKYAR
ncbi:MAG: hypothetical protein U0T82_13660 [Bacteroidales bacterium]